MTSEVEAESHPTAPKKSKTLWYWLAGFTSAALVILGLLAYLYASIVPLVNQYGSQILSEYFAPGSQIKIRSLRSDFLDIEELYLPLDSETDIRIQNSQLTYSIQGLLAARLVSFKAESIEVQLSDAPDAPASDSLALPVPSNGASTVPSNSASPSPASFSNYPISIPLLAEFAQLPLEQAEITKLALSSPDISVTTELGLSNALWWARGQLTTADFSRPLQLEVQLQEPKSEQVDALIMLSDNDASFGQIWARINQTDDTTELALELSGDLKEMAKLLPDLASLPLSLEQVSVSGQLSSPNQAVWPQDVSGQLAIDLELNDSLLSDSLLLGGAHLFLKVDHQQPVSPWLASLTSTRLEFESGSSEQELIEGHLDALDWQLECSAGLDACEVAPEFVLAVEDALESYQLTLASSPFVRWNMESGAEADLPFQFGLAMAETESSPQLDAQGSSQFKAALSQQGEWKVSSQKGIQLLANMGSVGEWNLPPLTLELLRDSEVTGHLATPDLLTTAPLSMSLSPFVLQAADKKLVVEQLAVSCLPGQVRLADAIQDSLSGCEIEAGLADSQWQTWPVPDVQLTGKISARLQQAQQTVLAQLEIKAANQQVALRSRIEHDLTNNRGDMQWHLTDAQLDWHEMGLAELENLTQVQLLNGQVSGQGWVDWQQIGDTMEVTPDIMLRADDISAIYDNSITIENADLMLALRRPSMGEYLLDAQFVTETIDTGISLDNILARSQVRIPADFSYVDLTVEEVHTDILGGRIYAPFIKYDSRKETNSFAIRLDHIQLMQLAELEAQSGIEATGLLDGRLPVIITEDGPSIPGGRLFARAPGGTVKFQGETAESLGGSDPSVGLAMQLLENFHYDTLESGIQYQTDGSLMLALQFQGNNPDFYDGQATNLNINLDYNLLDLLESLRLSQGIVEKLEQKYSQ